MQGILAGLKKQKIKDRILEIYDIETLCNLFTYTGYVPSEDKYYQFVICSFRNDLEELIKHLSRGIYMVGFNNEGFDYPVIHHLLNHYEEYKYMSCQELAMKLHKKAQDVIDMEFSAIADWNKFIPQLDLFKIWHFDNKGRACSLKHLEVAMRLHNVEDMPIKHDQWITTWEQVELVLGYNKNDVYATYEFYKITKGDTDHVLYEGRDKLYLRKDLQKKYGLKCLNYPDVKIGEELLLKLYCDNTGFDPKVVRSWKTPREFMKLSECILPYIKFKTAPFQALKSWLDDQIIYGTNGVFNNLKLDAVEKLKPYLHPETIKKKNSGIKEVSNLNIRLQDTYIAYGTGGLHSSISGKFVSDDEWIILDIDVGSLYPSIAVQNNFYPEHLGAIFARIYDDNIVSIRLKEKEKPKKERDFVIMEGFKLAANGTYGKSNEETSFLYDPMYTMKTTINGQLLLSMLIEEILINIVSVLFIQCNTDGVTVKLKRTELDKCLELCKEWEKKTNLVLEYSYYKMMAVVDVSTYIAVYENGDIKQKNDFEIDKELYKNPSMRIVPIALREYFINGTPVDKTIKEHKDIFDFCLMVRCNKNYDLVYRKIEDGKIIEKDASKTQRYYATNNGVVLYKKNLSAFDEDGNMRYRDPETGKKINPYTGVNVGQQVRLFNQYFESDMEGYDIDYNFYIKECRKVIDKVELSAIDQLLF